MLSLLQPLGLQSIVTTEVVLQSARHAGNLSTTDPNMARQRGHALLTFLAIDSLKWLGTLASQLNVRTTFHSCLVFLVIFRRSEEKCTAVIWSPCHHFITIWRRE